MFKKVVGLFFVLALTLGLSMAVFASDYAIDGVGVGYENSAVDASHDPFDSPEVREVQGVTVRMSVSDWIEQRSQYTMYRDSHEELIDAIDLFDDVLIGDYVYVTTFSFYFCDETGLLHPVEDMAHNGRLVLGNFFVRAVWFNTTQVRWEFTNQATTAIWINGSTNLWCAGGIVRDWATLNRAIPFAAIMYNVATLDTNDFFIPWRYSTIEFLQDGWSMPPHGQVFSATAWRNW